MNTIQKFLKEGVEYSKNDYDQFRDNGSKSFDKFLKSNPEFDNEDFRIYVTQNNKADCDEGELNNIHMDEIIRLAQEFRRE
jgi:type III secretory pathway component EscR